MKINKNCSESSYDNLESDDKDSDHDYDYDSNQIPIFDFYLNNNIDENNINKCNVNNHCNGDKISNILYTLINIYKNNIKT